MFNIKKAGITCFLLTCFALLTFVTYKKTNYFSLKPEILEDFEEFYFEKKMGDVNFVPEVFSEAENSENDISLEYVVQFKDTIESIFSEFEFQTSDYRKVVNLLSENIKKMKIFAGQKLNIRYKAIIKYIPSEEFDEEIMPSIETKNQTNIFQGLTFQTSESNVEIFRLEGDKFEIKIIPFQKLGKKKFVQVRIKTSLYQDGIDAGISPNILENLIRLYSFDIDFQRDIRDGDTFEILYEEIFDEITGKKLRDGNIFFSKITSDKASSKSFEYYLFKGEYYDGNGKTSQKSFLKTPVPGARLTSRFGIRKHPILGFTRLHAGIDFAAPRGTPIFAAATGKITFIGWNGGPKTGYGKLVIIKHNSTYSTAYAHMNGFRKGLSVGSNVKQGEVIGYVGNTGYSTGPHLHYEVWKNGAKVNPSKITSFAVKTLSAKELEEFKATKTQLISTLHDFKK
jgi:murein DD-endopeptidase MepM/ murein hydrolase activator NlpD